MAEWRNKVAITTINTGIRTISGVIFFIQDITKFVHISTAIVANPMESPFIALVVVANVGHIPRNNIKVGFSLISPLSNILKLLIIQIFKYTSFFLCIYSISLINSFQKSATCDS